MIADAITTYLRAHPQAADGVEGIRQWWLPPTLAVRSAALVEEALERLIARGVVVRQRMPDGTVLYRRAEAARTDGQTDRGTYTL
ncbi:MAG: hypothetical protein AB7N65_18335 [Vicinamibacterales bacterium]